MKTPRRRKGFPTLLPYYLIRFVSICVGIIAALFCFFLEFGYIGTGLRPVNASVKGYAYPAQQNSTVTLTVTSTPTSTLTPGATSTPTSTGTIGPSPTDTPTVTVTGSVTNTYTPQPTATATLLPSPTLTPQLQATLFETPKTLVSSVETLTATVTLLPFPSITFQYPQFTPTPYVLSAERDPYDQSLSKPNPQPPGTRLLRLWPCAVLLVIWLVLGALFILTQRQLRR